ncbi:MAG: DegV family protein [Oscillospiraceae bacterium]|nr:DegV family protein [Oscillospiraceae bacterium]
MNIKITADSTCDLSPDLIEQHNITLIPLTVHKGGQLYRDGVDITPADIFAHVAGGGAICTTAAVNVYDYQTMFKRLREEYDAVVHINLGSDLSACYQNACSAAADIPGVYPVDSKNLSTGHGHVVMEACRLAKNCTDAGDIEAMCERLREFAGRVEASFLLDRLDYMAKGGRCSMVAALGANLLKLKPCIEVVNGKMTVAKKYRGRYDKCLTEYVQDRLSNRSDILYDTLFITHTPVQPDDMAAVKAAVEKNNMFKNIYDTDAGGTISCHCGPGTLGVLFVRKTDRAG